MHDPLRRPDPPAQDDVERVAAAMDAEVRAEQAAYEAEALRAEQRARSLADLVVELAVRGDEVEVRVAGRVLRGRVVAVGAGHLVLAEVARTADVVLDAIALLRVAARNRDPVSPARRGTATLRARMTEHEVAGSAVTALLRDGEEVTGVVTAAAVDHLLLETRRGPAAIPWAALAATWPTSPTA